MKIDQSLVSWKVGKEQRLQNPWHIKGGERTQAMLFICGQNRNIVHPSA
jgi:hypothetical protein